MADSESSTEHEVRLSRWPRKGAVAVFLVSVLVAGGGGFMIATALRAEDSQTLDNSLRAVPVTAKATERTVSLPPFRANLSAANTIDVPVSVPPGATTAAVTATPKAPGDSVGSGQEILEISGRPLITLAMSLPMFRDLGVGMKGVDVKSLNQALKDIGLLSDVDDAYTYRTRIAVKELYEKNDAISVGALGGESLPMREIVRIPSGGLTVGSVAALASVVGTGESAMTLVGGVPNITVRVDALVKNSLEVGGDAAVSASASADGVARAAQILAISEFRSVGSAPRGATASGAGEDRSAADEPQTGEGTGSPASAEENVPTFPGYDVTLAFADPASVGWRQGAALTVTFVTDATKRLAVPLTAIREDGSQQYVNRATNGTVHGSPSPSSVRAMDGRCCPTLRISGSATPSASDRDGGDRPERRDPHHPARRCPSTVLEGRRTRHRRRQSHRA